VILLARIATLVLGAMFAGWDSPTNNTSAEMIAHGLGGGLLTTFVLLSASRQ